MGRRAVAALFSMALYCGCVYGEEQQESADSVEKTESLKYDLSDYRNFFGICWSSDTNSDVLDYARQMGHTHVVYRSGMEKLPQAKGMSFFIEDPEFGARLRMMDYDKK